MYTLERSNYPKGDVVYRNKPAADVCADRSSPVLIEKTTKRDGTVRYCKNEDCGYKMAVGNTELTSEAPAAETTLAGQGGA